MSFPNVSSWIFSKSFYRFILTSFKVYWDYQPIVDISDIAYEIWITSLIPGLPIYLSTFSKNFILWFIMIYERFSSWGPKPTADFTVSNSPTLHVFWLCGKSEEAHTNTGITPQQKGLLAQLGPFSCEATTGPNWLGQKKKKEKNVQIMCINAANYIWTEVMTFKSLFFVFDHLTILYICRKC